MDFLWCLGVPWWAWQPCRAYNLYLGPNQLLCVQDDFWHLTAPICRYLFPLMTNVWLCLTLWRIYITRGRVLKGRNRHGLIYNNRNLADSLRFDTFFYSCLVIGIIDIHIIIHTLWRIAYDGFGVDHREITNQTEFVWVSSQKRNIIFYNISNFFLPLWNSSIKT